MHDALDSAVAALHHAPPRAALRAGDEEDDRGEHRGDGEANHEERFHRQPRRTQQDLAQRAGACVSCVRRGGRRARRRTLALIFALNSLSLGTRPGGLSLAWRPSSIACATHTVHTVTESAVCHWQCSH